MHAVSADAGDFRPRPHRTPVTPGVAGSSPVHSANDAFDDDDLAAFGRLSSFYRSFGIEGTSTHGRRSHQYPAARSTLAGMSPDSR